VGLPALWSVGPGWKPAVASAAATTVVDSALHGCTAASARGPTFARNTSTLYVKEQS